MVLFRCSSQSEWREAVSTFLVDLEKDVFDLQSTPHPVITLFRSILRYGC